MNQGETVFALDQIVDVINHWLTWNANERNAEKLVTDDSTYVVCVPPHWPTRGTLKTWREAIASGRDLISKSMER